MLKQKNNTNGTYYLHCFQIISIQILVLHNCYLRFRYILKMAPTWLSALIVVFATKGNCIPYTQVSVLVAITQSFERTATCYL